MSKRIHKIDKLLGQVFLQIGTISRLGKNLEKEHKTKIIFAEICLISDNGEAVYNITILKENNKLIPNLIKSLGLEDSEIKNGFNDKLAQAVPFNVFVKFKGGGQND